MKIFIIHGSYGNPEENWFPWLKKELEKLNYKVIIPKFPTPENQSLKSWMEVFDSYLKDLDKDTILIGHSLGPAFILNILEKINRPIKASFTVAGFVGKLDNRKFGKINSTFTEKEFNWEKIKENCPVFYFYNSIDDPYVSFSKGEELSKRLGGKLIKFKNAGHFNENAGFKQFPQLLDDIKSII